MKKIIISLLILFLFSCSETEKNILNGYYFDISSSDIYNFENSKLIKYNISDSIITNKKYIIEENTLKINNKIFPFEKNNDTLLVYDFSNENENVVLKKISYTNLKAHEIDDTCWVMEVTQILREDNSKFKEKQLLNINLKKGIDAYYIKSKDTLYGDHFQINGKMFNKFFAFKKDYVTIVLINKKRNEIEIILCYGNQTKAYKLKKVASLAKSRLPSQPHD